MPAITGPLAIAGGDCDPGPDAKPCVGVSASGSTTMFNVTAGSAALSGLALTGASVGIQIGGTSTGSTVRGSWFGLALDQSKAQVGTGVLIAAAGATTATIGGATAAQRNVFAYTSVAVDIFEADSNVVTGNYFAALPDGSLAPSPFFGAAIRIKGAGSEVATNNRFGGPDAGTPGVCDGECNLVVGGSKPVALGAAGAPADGTAIVGNFLGIALDGTTPRSIGNGVIDLAGATNTTIGGPTAASRNVVDSSTAAAIPAVSVDAASTGAVIRSNYFGVSADGTQVVENEDDSVRNSAAGTQVRDNVFGSSGDPGADGELSLREGGDGVVVTGNSFGVGPGGADLVTNTGDAPLLGVQSDGNQIGGTAAGEGNVFGYANDVAILIGASAHLSDSNTIVGNRIGTDASETASYPIAEDGIVLSSGSTSNVIGGTTAAAENVISNVAQSTPTSDAIEVVSQTSSQNRLLRNRGTGNGQLFIDLAPPTGPGNDPTTGPNAGIQAPGIGTLTTTGVSGSGATVGAVVRAYRTLGTGGDVQELVGSATAISGGTWSITFSSALPTGACVFVNQTTGTGNSSELSDASPVGGGSCDATPPNTVLNPLDQPTLFDTSTPSIFFDVSPFETPVTYACVVDPPGGAPVASPNCPSGTFTPAAPLADGAYTVSMAARDSLGNQDPTPATHAFTIDTTAPALTIDSGPADGATIADPRPAFGFSAVDLTAVGFQCRLDAAAFGACSGPSSHTPASDLADGGHTFGVQATDQLGHQSIAERAFTVDSTPEPPPDQPADPDATPPETTIAKAPKRRSTKRKARFALESSEAGSTFECALDKKPFKPCGTKVKFRVKPGKHTLRARAIDAAGNADQTPAIARWKVKRRR